MTRTTLFITRDRTDIFACSRFKSTQVTARVAGHKCSLEDRSPWIALRKINNTSPNKCLGRVLDRRHLKVFILITVTSSTKIVICFGIFHSVS